MKTETRTSWTVQSSNFDYHAPVPATDYADALRVAKARGWEARLELDGELVATWSPLYGTRIYNRLLAA